MGVELSVCKVDKRKWPREKLRWIAECEALHHRFVAESGILWLCKELGSSYSDYDIMVVSLLSKPPLAGKAFKHYPFVGENCTVLTGDEVLTLAEGVKKLFAIEGVSAYYFNRIHAYKNEGDTLHYFLSAIANIQEEQEQYEYVYCERGGYIWMYKIDKSKWPFEYLSSLFQPGSSEFSVAFTKEIELFEMRKSTHPCLMAHVFDHLKKKGIDSDEIGTHYPLLPEYSGMEAFPLPSSAFQSVLLEIKQELDYLHAFEAEILAEVVEAKKKGERHPFEKYINTQNNRVDWDNQEEIKTTAGPTTEYACLFPFEEHFDAILADMSSENYVHSHFEYVFWYH